MVRKKKPIKEEVVVPSPEATANDVPEINDTLEEAYVVDDNPEMPKLTSPASTDLGSGLAGSRPEPQRPVVLVTDDEEPVTEEPTETAPAPEEPKAETTADTPAETTSEASVETQAETPAETPSETPAETPAEGAGEAQEVAPVKLSPEELRASQRAAADAILKAPTNTAESLARDTGTAALDAGKPDFTETLLRDSQGNEIKSVADYLQGIRDDFDRERQAALIQAEANEKGAKYTGYTELGAAIANLIGVGAGNAVSQQYKSFSQDWMKKADQDMREHRSRIDNLRDRQRATEMKMAEMKSQQSLALAKFQLQREQQKYETEYRKAQIAYQNARTEAARQKAEQDAKEAELKLKYVESQIASQEALAAQRRASASASLRNAASRASATENQNRNRDSSTENQNRNRDRATDAKVAGANNKPSSTKKPDEKKGTGTGLSAYK